ncbi:hypothetical protein [Streptomyces sp. KLOTTS4A1]|uniref:hypothetical protein n=1 Tax=Streptomyces sp. KLOTTS4A1 TaxID=3390996 RepID=UPI0039F5F859
MTTDLSKLTSAAAKWDEMAGKFKKLEEQYKSEVHGISLGPNWQGISAFDAFDRFDVTLNEYKGAQAEAKAIAALLRDAHTQFVDLVGRVKSARADAIKAGMAVSEQGMVRFDFANADPTTANAARHDPSLGETEASWASHIQAAVKAVNDADAGVKIALEAVVVDTNPNDGTLFGFNSGAKEDIEEYEAEHAKDIATRINSGEKVSATDMAELKRTFRDNAHDKNFSETFLKSLGAENTLKFTNRLNGFAYSDDRDRKQEYLGLQKGLATTLATATKDTDSQFYKDFRSDLQKAGVRQFDVDGISPIPDEKIRGYQSLVTLMQQGNGYSGQFLQDVAHDIRKAEESHIAKGNIESIWALRDEFAGKERGWFANDPLDGILGVMSENPQASTEYLDPKQNDNLKYLLEDRDKGWETVIDHFATPPGGTTIGLPIMAEDGDVRTGLGLALEAGTTGREPLSPGAELERHTEAQARIMHDTINLLDYGVADGHDAEGADPANGDNVLKGEDYAHMRGPLARAMASYTPDMVDILAGDGPGGRVGERNALAEGGDSQIQNSRGSILRLMRGVSEDSENFFLLHDADRRYMAEQLASDNLSDPEALNTRAAKVGEVYGAINAIGGDIDLSERDAKLSAAGDRRVYGYHVVGSTVTGIPVVGDIAQRTIDGYWNEWLKGVTAEEGLLARDRISSSNDAAEQALDNFFQSSGEANHRTETEIGASQREARQSYTGGRELAYDALRERK